MRIYAGNLSYSMTEDELRQEFTAFGEVASVTIPTDRYSGQPKGFGFVDMPNNAEAEAAILALNGKALKGRNLTVSEARPRTESASGDRGGDRGGYSGGGGYGGKGGRESGGRGGGYDR